VLPWQKRPDAIAVARGSLDGETAFLLHDTFGFPIDLTVEIASESGLEVDRVRFDELMKEQRDRAKADSKAKKTGGAQLQVYSDFRAAGATDFTGYQTLESEGTIIGLIHDGDAVQSLSMGQIGEVLLDRTSLYAESGGQAADAGLISGDSFELEVLDVQKPVRGLFSHSVRVLSGQVTKGNSALTKVNPQWRLGACQAHSATHVVHAALRQVLGPQALQSGSYNKPGYMRLDFSWGESLSDLTKSEIEEVSNLAIRSDLGVSAQFMTLPDAKSWGAIALFDETYDEMVRVVQVGGPWSRELCGGTHVTRTSQIGLVSITGESSVGSGSRRIEAEVGFEALEELIAQRETIRRIAAGFKAPASEVEAKIAETLDELKTLQKKLAEAGAKAALSLVPNLLSAAKDEGGLRIVANSVGELSGDALRMISLQLKEQLGPKSLVILGGTSDGRATVMVAAGAEAVASGVDCGAMAKKAAEILGGGGGGKKDLAQGGGPESTSLPKAISEARGMI